LFPGLIAYCAHSYRILYPLLSDLIEQSILYALRFTLNVETGNRLKPWMFGNEHKYLHQAFPLTLAFFTFPCCAGFSLPAVFFLSILFWVCWVRWSSHWWKKWERRHISLCSCL